MSEAAFIGGLVSVAVALVFIRIAALERRLNRLSRVEAKLDAILKHGGVHFDEFQDVPASVREALERGETIQAIKHFREATGAGLKEAKEIVNELRRRRTTS